MHSSGQMRTEQQISSSIGGMPPSSSISSLPRIPLSVNDCMQSDSMLSVRFCSVSPSVSASVLLRTVGSTESRSVSRISVETVHFTLMALGLVSRPDAAVQSGNAPMQTSPSPSRGQSALPLSGTSVVMLRSSPPSVRKIAVYFIEPLYFIPSLSA